MPYSTHPSAFSTLVVAPNPGDVAVTSTSKSNRASVVTTVVSVPVFPNGSAIAPVPAVELRPTWKFVVRAAVAVDHHPPPLISSHLPAPPPACRWNNPSGSPYGGFAPV